MTSSEDLARWDQAAQVYAQTVGGDGDSFYRRLVPFLWQQFGVSGRRLLDVGCGHGWLTDRLSQAGASVVGVDGSKALIDIARRRHPELEFEVFDLTEGLPRPVRRYDRIVSHMVLMDIPIIDRLLADVAACLRPDGVLCFRSCIPVFLVSLPSRTPTRVGGTATCVATWSRSNV